MIVPDHLKKLMSPADRALLQKGDITWEEALERGKVKNEAELQRLIVSWLKSARGVNWVIWSRTDKPTTNAKGTPDICFARRMIGHGWKEYTQCIAWEVKLPGEKLKPDQEEAREAMIKDGWMHAVIHSLTEAKQFLDAL